MQRRACPPAENSRGRPLRDDDRDEVVLRSHQIHRGLRRCAQSRPDGTQHARRYWRSPAGVQPDGMVFSTMPTKHRPCGPALRIDGIADGHGPIIIETRPIRHALNGNSAERRDPRLALVPTTYCASSHAGRSRLRISPLPDIAKNASCFRYGIAGRRGSFRTHHRALRGHPSSSTDRKSERAQPSGRVSGHCCAPCRTRTVVSVTA